MGRDQIHLSLNPQHLAQLRAQWTHNYQLTLNTREETDSSILGFLIESSNKRQLRWKSATDGGWRQCRDHELFYHPKQSWELLLWDACFSRGVGGEACSRWFPKIYCFTRSNNLQGRQICQVDVYIRCHVITTVSLKILSRKFLYFMWTSLKNRLKETEEVKVKAGLLVSPDSLFSYPK